MNPSWPAFEFEKVSVTDARRVLHGIPAEPVAPAWIQQRARQIEEPLLRITQTWLDSLPESVRPTELARQYPRIPNRLRRLWKEAAECEDYLQSLLVDRRGELREGFPSGIAEELAALQDYHSTLNPRAASKWDRE